MFLNLPTVADLKVGVLPKFSDFRGTLIPLELTNYISFNPVRLFWITNVPINSVRGEHAHKACTQFMICCSGAIKIDVYDGENSQAMDVRMGEFINIPPLIYAKETFLEENTSLLVICDRPYETDDYIKTREELREYKLSYKRT